MLHHRTTSLLVVLCLGHVLLISAQVQSRSGLPLLQAVAFGAFAKTQSGTASVADWFRGVWSHYLALRGVAAENDTLRRQVLELQGQLQQEQAVADASRSLEDALKLQQSMPAPTLAARVIAGSPQPGSLTLTVTINRGAADGVQPNMAVIGGLGVIGRVINQPSAHAAQVQLLLDRNAAAAVTLARTGAGGIIKGGASDGLYSVDYVSNQADVQVGERVLTSGQDGIFPAGFIVGYVAKSEKGANYRLVRVSPAVDFSHIDLVLVVLGRPPVAPTTPPSPAAAAAGRGRGGL